MPIRSRSVDVSIAKRIARRGTVQRYSEAVAQLKAPGDAVIVTRGVPRSIVMQCPDGCGEVITLNVDRRSGPAWRFFERRAQLTIYPSIWRDSGCGAHFIVWNNAILWCDRKDADGPQWEDPELVTAVERVLPPPLEPHRHFEEIASQLDAVPWEVLWACHSLERAGKAESSERSTRFGRSRPRATSVDRIDIKV
jgi:hypothetical protein